MLNIITGSENKIRAAIQAYGIEEIGSYGDGKLFLIYDDENLSGDVQIVEKEVIKEVIKEVEVEVFKEVIKEIDNPKIASKLEACQIANTDLAKENKTLKAQNGKLKKAIEAME